MCATLTNCGLDNRQEAACSSTLLRPSPDKIAPYAAQLIIKPVLREVANPWVRKRNRFSLTTSFSTITSAQQLSESSDHLRIQSTKRPFIRPSTRNIIIERIPHIVTLPNIQIDVLACPSPRLLSADVDMRSHIRARFEDLGRKCGDNAEAECGSECDLHVGDSLLLL